VVPLTARIESPWQLVSQTQRWWDASMRGADAAGVPHELKPRAMAPNKTHVPCCAAIFPMMILTLKRMIHGFTAVQLCLSELPPELNCKCKSQGFQLRVQHIKCA
jgi:hypothetical protein